MERANVTEKKGANRYFLRSGYFEGEHSILSRTTSRIKQKFARLALRTAGFKIFFFFP